MLSHTNRCIFVHIPKSAGTSLTRVFSDHNKATNTDRNLLPFDPDENKFDPPPPHLRAYDYVKYGRITKELFDSYFKFAFVRNPWDRVVSEYKYRRHAQKYSFKIFLFEHFPMPSWSDQYCHVIPQYDFLHDQNGILLVDFVGRFENLQEDFTYICDRLNIKIKTLPHHNKSTSIFNRRDNNVMEILRSIKSTLSITRKRNTFQHYVDYYDDESIEFVANLYRKDIETFDYNFGV
jgi:hypothetical protein